MTYMAMVDPIAVGTLTADSPAAPAVLGRATRFFGREETAANLRFFRAYRGKNPGPGGKLLLLQTQENTLWLGAPFQVARTPGAPSSHAAEACRDEGLILAGIGKDVSSARYVRHGIVIHV